MRLAGWPGGTRSAMPWPFDGRVMALTTMTVIVIGASLVGALNYPPLAPWAAFIPLGLVVLGIAAWIVAAAFAGSPAAIMIYFALLTFMIDAQFRVRGAGDIDADWQSLMKFALWLGAGVIGIAHMPPLGVMLSRLGPACWLAYIAVALMSSLYSPVPGYSFGCAFALLCLFAFSFSLTTRLTESQLLWTFTLSLAVFCVAGWVVFYVYPDLGTSAFWTYGGWYYRMCGIAGQATNLGSVCAKFLGATFLLWYSGRCGLLAALVLGGLAAVTLVASDCRTAEVAALAGIAAVLLSRSRWALALGVLVVLIGYIASLSLPHALGALGSHFSRSGDPSEVYTLTGRLEIWDFVWRRIQEQPWLGWGYNSGKAVLGQYYGFTNGLMVDSAHNLYLQNLLSVGIIGVLPMAILLVGMSVRFLTRPIPIVTYFLAVVLVSSISDTQTLGTTPTLMTIMFLVVSVWPEPPHGRGAART